MREAWMGSYQATTFIPRRRARRETYPTSLDKASRHKGEYTAFAASPVLAIASMGRLLTPVVVLRFVELRMLRLEHDLRPLFPDMGTLGISFDDGSVGCDAP
ncbi:hypothetical protein CDD83_10512 [Cordyceps sp. RAO-2017]|nr:hypothetical protein CDD83_10512 [Cordyceps sp. RAO-2017]